jgi:hypothetical protein
MLLAAVELLLCSPRRLQMLDLRSCGLHAGGSAEFGNAYTTGEHCNQMVPKHAAGRQSDDVGIDSQFDCNHTAIRRSLGSWGILRSCTGVSLPNEPDGP